MNAIAIQRELGVQPHYPRVAIWRDGKMVQSGESLMEHIGYSAHNGQPTSVYLRRWRKGKALMTLNWGNGAWSTTPLENFEFAQRWCAANKSWPEAQVIE